MGDRAKQAAASVREFFGKLSRRTRILLGIVLAATLVTAAGLGIYHMTRPYAVLFQDLSADNMSAVLNFLESNDITDYRVQNNNRILVPESQEYSIRARILMENYSSTNSNYELYLTNIGALSSDSDRRQLQLYDLQNRLGATIESFEGVRGATVYISLGEDRRYILNSDDVSAAEASVSLTMQDGKTLTDQQANAIRNLVSHAVQGLSIDNVGITDSSGTIYYGDNGSGAATSDAAKMKLDLERQINTELRNKIMEPLAAMFGLENVRVTVTSTVDVVRRYEESTTYEEPEWALEAANGQGIIGRRVWGNSIVREGGEGAGGVPGTTTNSDINEYVVNQSNLDGTEREISTSGSVDYIVDTTTTQSEIPVGSITDLYVSVLINSTNVDVPATADLVSLIAKAAGINEELEGDKIAVMAFPFYVSPPAPPLDNNFHWFGLDIPQWVVPALIAGLILFLILFLLIFLLRRRARKRKAQKLAEEQARLEAEALAAAAAAAAEYPEGLEGAAPGVPPTEGADIMEIHTERSMELLKDVRQFVEENPGVAAQMIKTWLRGGEEDA